MRVLFPGSFDPFTLGHLALVRRAATLFDRVTVGVFHNENKGAGLLAPEERAELIRLACQGIPQVDVAVSEGFVADFCHREGISLLIRGIRGEKDLPFEKEAEAYNRAHGVETLFFLAEEASCALSSTEVRRQLSAGGDVSALMPAGTLEFLLEKSKKSKNPG